MSRIRSPGYPNASLDQVIEFVEKIHNQDRQHPVDRTTAARHIGFSGLSGTSDRALSALMHYGLMEKVKKGEMRVTDLALRAIHPTNPTERRVALYESAFSPELFKELRQRYPESPPSRDSLSSYLSRSGFASAAIPSATKAYLETCHFLQREGAYEISVAAEENAAESAPIELKEESIQMSAPPTSVASSAPLAQPSATSFSPPVGILAEGVLNTINMNIQGDRVHVDAFLDFKGLIALEKKIAGLKVLMEPIYEANDTGDDED